LRRQPPGSAPRFTRVCEVPPPTITVECDTLQAQFSVPADLLIFGRR